MGTIPDEDAYLKALEASQKLFCDYPDVVTTQQICSMLNVGIKKVYELIKNGELRTLNCTKNNRVLKVDVIIYVLGLNSKKDKERGDI